MIWRVESLAVGTLTAYVKPGRDLQTFRDFAPVGSPSSTGRGPVSLACGSILAEIVLRHAGADSNPPLFEALVEGLRAVAAAPQGDTLAPMKNQVRQAGQKMDFTESRKQNPGGQATHTTGNSGGKKGVAKILPANALLPQAA